MKALYCDSATHEVSMLEVTPDIREGFYREGVRAFAASGDLVKLHNDARELRFAFDEKFVLAGRNGFLRLVSDDEARAILAASDVALAGRRAKAAATPAAAYVERCHSCGFPRTGRGECDCGDNTR